MTATTKSSPTSSTTAQSNCCYADLVLWKDVQKSGITFSSVFAVLYLLQNYTVLGLLSYGMFLVTSSCCLWVLIKNVISAFQHQQGQQVSAAHPFQYLLDFLPSKLNISEEKAAESAPAVAQFVNKHISQLIKLILIDSWMNSSILVIVLYFTRGILASYSVLCLCTMGWCAAFTLPFVYKMKQAEIDGLLKQVVDPIKPHVAKIQGMVKKFQQARESVGAEAEAKKD